ncbi:tRNA (uridine(54)-C5)-methyltransferase TrmA [Kineobactrum sediminis]|uniref:tRNA/tmRNA (uracil-C(5))-methyltransferase n=1 Tax=Kineobactrum sediminis TaxID=1905677 RepID=A0A2N5Y199_9GAMM|nr:tRNA (uridine(54)-C5)-methyltransferase TrmA [Kineobactrum sediminis]PLW82165.1 tRNA (uridine(54)-C5)-methyltransferase TrmA [Kineobactrum sediminis]
MPLSRFDPDRYPELLAAKAATTSALLQPFAMPEPMIVPSVPTGFRMRAEFRIWHDGHKLDYVMFRPGEPDKPIPIHDLPIACERIRALMPLLRQQLQDTPLLRHKLFQVEFLSTLAGDTLVTLIYHRKLDEHWREAATALAALLDIPLVGRARKQKEIIGRDYVTEVLPIEGREYHYRQYEQAFSQPNARVNIRMIEWACRAAAPLGGDLLELYCGNGNFTLPLARHFNAVVATELAKVSIRAAQWNLEANRVNNVQMIRLAAQEVCQAMAGEREFRRLADLPQPLPAYNLDTVLVDPPRAGLDAATETMVQGFATIIYVSCNSHSLAENLQSLAVTHDIVDFALFDQFPYTDHMECGVVLQRKSQ